MKNISIIKVASILEYRIFDGYHSHRRFYVK